MASPTSSVPTPHLNEARPSDREYCSWPCNPQPSSKAAPASLKHPQSIPKAFLKHRRAYSVHAYLCTCVDDLRGPHPIQPAMLFGAGKEALPCLIQCSPQWQDGKTGRGRGSKVIPACNSILVVLTLLQLLAPIKKENIEKKKKKKNFTLVTQRTTSPAYRVLSRHN